MNYCQVSNREQFEINFPLTQYLLMKYIYIYYIFYKWCKVFDLTVVYFLSICLCKRKTAKVDLILLCLQDENLTLMNNVVS